MFLSLLLMNKEAIGMSHSQIVECWSRVMFSKIKDQENNLSSIQCKRIQCITTVQ